MLDAYGLVHYKAFAFILFPTLAKYDKCSPLLYTLLRKSKLLHEDDVKMLLVLGVRNPQSTACDVWCLRFQD
jgi:hypothetical protein